ncbi:MAG: dihydrofolate synthase / folylpolyglutamate synthase [Gammaproteobacteria bacterium]|nr:dihydrofolate synthase / folylpolyglutamate synthase [Gammaproteobacteria bacterium]
MQVKPKIASLDSYIADSMRFNKLHEWLAWQEGLHFTAIELGLDRCMSVADKMGLLQPDYAVISVAGTNGKGSSVNMLRSILTHAGYTTGSYTSPHLIRYNERVSINGIEVSDAALCEAFDRIDRARGDISLTYFEFGTLAALDIFQRAGIDIAILEVGLGGRLDAVNCLDADVALIASIDLDHELWLGPDREAIAREKAGIMRSKAPAVCSDPGPPQSLINHAKMLGTRLYLQKQDYDYQICGNSWTWRWDSVMYTDLPHPSIYNARQVQNAAGVLMALTALSDRFPVAIHAIRQGLLEFNLDGRFQIVPDKAQLVLDVAHNRQAAELLAQNLRQLPVSGNTHILIGMLSDKNHHAIFNEISGSADFWHLVTLDGPRGTKSEALNKVLMAMGITGNVSCYDTVADALGRVRAIVAPQDRIVITGSFLTVGAAINHLNLQH